MLENLRNRLAYRAALKAAANRTAVQRPADPREARVLLLLPEDESMLRAAWRFALQFDLGRSQLTPVVLGERLTYSPDAFAGAVDLLSSKELDWRGVPEKKVLDAFWSPPPHVVINLALPFSPAQAYLAGASPAGLRVGLYDKAAEPFFDLLLAPTESLDTALAALRGYLSNFDPPVLAFK